MGTFMTLLCMALTVGLLIILFRNFIQWVDDFRVEKNPYNKYRIYLKQSNIKKDVYFARVVVTYLFFIIPVYKKYKYIKSVGFEDYTCVLQEWDSTEEAEKDLEDKYKKYRKYKSVVKIKRVK